MTRLRIAIVTPRYGATVGGGAEALARKYAMRLAITMDVTVLTTCALDYATWRDHFPAGEASEDGVRVLRFSVPHPRDPRRFDELSWVLADDVHEPRDESLWMDAQGPVAPDLLRHLEAHGTSYDAILFVPYLYATTVLGLPIVAERSILIPALHDEPPLRLEIFRPVIESAQAWVFSTPEEQQLAMSRFAIDPSRCHLVGAGVDVPPIARHSPALTELSDAPYVVCVGRIEPSKGSDVLIDLHGAYLQATRNGLPLVMVGPRVMRLPRRRWLHAPGFVSEAEKEAAIAGAVALVCPSPYESLSLVLLEAWAHGVPTIASARSDVLVGQTRRAGAGLWYRNAAEYAACVDLLARNPALRHGLGAAGRRFAKTLTWDVVIERLSTAIRAVAERAPAKRT